MTELESGSEGAVAGYVLFSRLFMQKTTREDLQGMVSFIDEATPRPGALFQELKDVFQKWLMEDGCEHDMTTEYTRLFHLREGVKPYESVYRGREPLLMQEPWVEVKNFYQERGWYMDNSNYPEDHLSVELSFVAHLLSEGSEDDARKFLEKHLLQWAPAFLKDLQANSYASYYRVIGRYCLSFLEEEKNYCQLTES